MIKLNNKIVQIPDKIRHQIWTLVAKQIDIKLWIQHRDKMDNNAYINNAYIEYYIKIWTQVWSQIINTSDDKIK